MTKFEGMTIDLALDEMKRKGATVLKSDDL
jgi:hypothetical protein